MYHTIRGQFRVSLPDNENEDPEITIFDKCGNPAQTLPIHPTIMEAIYDYQMRKHDLEDIDTYISNLEAGEEDVISGMTPEKLKPIRLEILELYQERRFNSDQWLYDLQNACQGWEYAHRVLKKYWKCPIDQYGQRNGDVIEVQMAEWQYESRKKHEFLYDSYEAALAAAQD